MKLIFCTTILFSSLISYDVLADQTAEREYDFLNSLGACAHLEQTNTPYGNATLVQSELKQIGVSHIRVQPPNGNLPTYKQLAAAGVRFDILLEQVGSVYTDAILASQIASLAPIISSVDSVEGPNEIDAWPITYNGISGPAAAIAFQKSIFNLAKSTKGLANADVLPFSLAANFPSGNSPATTYAGVSAYATVGNIHAYGGGVPPFWWVAGTLKQTDTPGLQQIITETGDTTAPAAGGVDNYTQAVWAVDSRLDTFLAGVKRTFGYQLMDPSVDLTGTQSESHFGLFNTDGTPKQAATALHNLSVILSDEGATKTTFTPGTLKFSISGLPDFWGFSTVLQKSNGVYDVILWQEPMIWNLSSHTDNTISPTNVTVTFPSPVAKVSIFDVITGSTPTSILSKVNNVVVPLGSDPMIVGSISQ